MSLESKTNSIFEQSQASLTHFHLLTNFQMPRWFQCDKLAASGPGHCSHLLYWNNLLYFVFAATPQLLSTSRYAANVAKSAAYTHGCATASIPHHPLHTPGQSLFSNFVYVQIHTGWINQTRAGWWRRLVALVEKKNFSIRLKYFVFLKLRQVQPSAELMQAWKTCFSHQTITSSHLANKSTHPLTACSS